MDASERQCVNWIATASLWVTLLVGGGAPVEAASGGDDSKPTEQADRDEGESNGNDSQQTDPASGDEAASDASGVSGWATSFQVSALPDALTERKLLVVAAGGRLNEAGAAAEFLRQSLEQAGAPLVMDQSNLGDVTDLSDQAIVETAGELPVEAILVVRVFGGGNGPNAVVSGYTPEGEALAGFNVRRGEALETDDTQGATQGISQETVDAIESTAESDDDHGGKSQKGRYSLNTYSTWRLTDEKKGDWYEGAAIYRQLDRPGLASTYETNRRRQRTTRWIGIGSGAAGLATAGVGLVMLQSAANRTYEYPECEQYELNKVEQSCRADKRRTETPGPIQHGRIITATGGVVAVVGAAVAGISLYADPHPLSASEMRQLIDRRQKNSEGKNSSEETAGRRGPGLSWSVTPTDAGLQGILRINW